MQAIHSSIGRDIHLPVANEFRDHRLAASTRVSTAGTMDSLARETNKSDCMQDPVSEYFPASEFFSNHISSQYSLFFFDTDRKSISKKFIT